MLGKIWLSNLVILDTKIQLEETCKLKIENKWELKENSKGFTIHTRVDPISG